MKCSKWKFKTSYSRQADFQKHLDPHSCSPSFYTNQGYDNQSPLQVGTQPDNMLSYWIVTKEKKVQAVDSPIKASTPTLPQLERVGSSDA